MRTHIRLLFGLSVLLALAACQSTPPEPGMKLGKPYAVDGEMYYPEYEPAYDKTGIASWYGPGFHGKFTASGEKFDQNDLTAAHPTLPMPSLVRVTNLSTGKSLIVRINDRGPFKSHRIIDLSKESARRLGIHSTAKVRVQFLQKETQTYLASIQNGGTYAIDMVQYNKDAESAPPTQIVENVDSSSHAGQMVDVAAPVLTVSEANLETNNKPAHKDGLIKSAYADDNVPRSSPDNSDTPGFNPPLSKAETEPHTMQMAELSSPPAGIHTAPGSGYIVQAGSFSSEENARNLASMLPGMGAVSVDKIDVGSKAWWRVRLGPFKNKQIADDTLAKVRAAGISDAKVVHL